ncbi:hypothetical protein [Bosea sp. 117]|uniref:hypothetical protein n=1 Tax=Bosea sp. 117 TaxID=1125973 RepID=UPI0004942ED6|nr:hypothetical protein [Bosea sp. 117]
MTMLTHDELKTALHRARVHLSLLEQDGTHPLDLALAGVRGAPALILRPGESLRSAHSDVRLDYELVRELMIAALQARVEVLAEKVGAEAMVPLDRLQYGDQTEA